MSTTVATIPQPLNGTEIKRGIAVRMTQDLPAEAQEAIREQIVERLGKVCSLVPNAAYAKFKAAWILSWWIEDTVRVSWSVTGTLDDYGHVTPFSMNSIFRPLPDDAERLEGTIDFTPPDRFRRETEQPIPKPVELKTPEPEKSTMSHAIKGPGKRRQV